MKKLTLQPERRWSAMFDWHVAIGCTMCSPACVQCASARWLNTTKKPALQKILRKMQDTGKVSRLLNEKRRVTVFNGTVKLQPRKLRQPLYLPEGHQVFVAGCSDLFHKQVPYDYVDKVVRIVKECPTLVFFVITRRPERAVEYSENREWPENLWVGTSAETQSLFVERTAHLAKIPAKYRGVSIKPILGPVDITVAKGAYNFIIAGGQSGQGAHPVHPNWVRKIRDDCQELSVAFQFHQWGTWGTSCGPDCTAHIYMDESGRLNTQQKGIQYHRVGCKNTGKTIDNQEWDQYPDTYREGHNASQ